MHGSIPKRPIAKTAPTKTAQKILISKKLSKTAHHTTKTAHSYIQNGPLSLSAFGNVQSDLEILYVEASYTRVRGFDDSETVKCSAMHYGVTCSKFKSVNATFPTQIPHKFNHKSHVRLRNNTIVTFCRDYYIPVNVNVDLYSASSQKAPLVLVQSSTQLGLARKHM